LLNNRDYQSSLEVVYLSALALTLNRFEFDARWFGRNTTTYGQTGFGSPISSSLFDTSNTLGFNRNLAMGGQLLVDFANSFVWEFAGGTHRTTGNFGVSLVQPLLRNFGRQVRLESLTQAERDTLYAVRDFARFRKRFWASTTTDGGGYLSLLLLQQSVRNARANLKSQEENYKLSLELLKGNKKSPVEVDTIFQGLLAARQSVLNAEIGLQEALDAYKLQLGLPPRIPVELDDTFLKQFILVDPGLEALQEEVITYGRERNAELGTTPSRESLQASLVKLVAIGERVAPLLTQVRGDLVRWEKDLENLSTDAEQRDRVRQAYSQQAEALAPQEQLLQQWQTRLTALRDQLTETTRATTWRTLTTEVTKLSTIVDTLVAAQTQARIYSIRLADVQVDEARAIEQAKANRLDLQNSLAQVTDAWRRVAVAANQLRSDLNLTTSATVVSSPNQTNPFAFNNDFSRFTVGLQFDSPLNRLAERNAYRISLISYQRARRSYMQLSDLIEQQIRSDVRSLRLQRISFEIARQSLIAAARQLENEQLLLLAPNQNQQGANAGDATLRKLRALDQLLAARDALAGSFIRYEQQRIRLLLNLEELQLDSRGMPTNASAKPEPERERSGPDAARPSAGANPAATPFSGPILGGEFLLSARPAISP
jgi:outer membrane protein TolC